jgi:fermentation-respiration switch protein FrsA (DUF1100 family)
VEPPQAGFEDHWLTLPEGTRIHAWYLPHPDPEAGAVLLSHGNGGNLSHRGGLIRLLQRFLGRSVLVYDYPGYGRSDGRPTEAGCYAAGDAAYHFLVSDRRIPPHRVVLYGESLGGGVAIDQASRLEHEALILLFTFTTLPRAAKWHFPFLPCETLMHNRFDNLSKIGRCRQPVLIAHSPKDRVVPYAHSQELYQAAHEPKQFLPLGDWGHDTPMEPWFFEALRQFLARGGGQG